MGVIYTLYVVNKSGGLIFSKVMECPKSRLGIVSFQLFDACHISSAIACNLVPLGACACTLAS